jgi:tRNA (guanosine-2'-O-)-methyltransferase
MQRERTPERLARLQQVLGWRQPDLTVVLDRLNDVHNLNAILRSCDAVGVFEAHLLYPDGRFPDFTKHGKRSSSGARKWVPRREWRSAAECFGALRARGMRVYASLLDEAAVPLHELDLTGRVALVFGNEKDGVSAEVLAAADGTFRVPMVGMVQSLNVSVAAAVSLYEAFRQRQAAGLFEAPRLEPGEFGRLLEEWSWE